MSTRMSIETINDVDAELETAKREWDTNGKLQRARQAVVDTHARCMKCHSDLAEGRITQGEAERWLRDRGEPAWQAAQQNLIQGGTEVFDQRVEPRLNSARETLTDRMQ